MEYYIQNKVSDITYQSELIPPAFLRKQEGGINSSFALLRTRWTILNKVKNLAQTLDTKVSRVGSLR